MSITISVEKEIQVPAEAAWAVLDDFAAISGWRSTILDSHTIGDQATGLGAERHCDLGKGRTLDERIVEYVAGERLVIDVFEAEGLSIASSLSAFDVVPTGPTSSIIRFDAEVEPASSSKVRQLLQPLLAKRFESLSNDFLDEWEAEAASRLARAA